ncbi:MAG: pilus assembly protein [Salinarimonadaceae bacterium]|nr:MAG: pilus assembly protein [Salinarimonadaceae bacterium]
MDLSTIAFVVLASVAAGGLAYVFLYPSLSGERRAEKRQAAVAARAPSQRIERAVRDASGRRDQVAQTLKEIEERRNSSKASLEDRLSQAGLGWTRSRFFIFSALFGLAAGLVVFVTTTNAIVAALVLFTGALGVPSWFVNYLIRRRIERFITELPNAMDVIVRGIRAGLPLGDCFREIASSAQEPLRTEFRMVSESQAMGVTLSEALEKLAKRVPVPEASFLATVITIQTKSGGNLSEALSNLSRVLRERKKMKGKIQAMSMEAKASAAIIASLPFIVAFMTYVSSPNYIELLWLTFTGKLVLAASAVWMMIGVLVMKKMINFDI